MSRAPTPITVPRRALRMVIASACMAALAAAIAVGSLLASQLF